MKAFAKVISVLLCLFPILLQGAEFQVKVIQNADDMPEKICSYWKKGDFLLCDGETAVLLGASPRYLQSILNYPAGTGIGCVLSFVPSGKNLQSDLNIGSPNIQIDGKRHYVAYSSLKPMDIKTSEEVACFIAEATYKNGQNQKAQVKTMYQYFLKKGRIDIISTIKNTGKTELKGLNYSLYFNANHSYSFTPRHAEKHPELSFRVYQKKGHYLAWIDQNSPGGRNTPKPGNLAPGEAFDVKYTILVDCNPNSLLQNIYSQLNVPSEKAVFYFKGFKGDVFEIIVKDALSSSVFFRSFLDSTAPVEISLPKGFYSVRANFFPTVVEKLFHVLPEKENRCLLYDKPKATVTVRVQNSKGEYVPGKVTFIGLSPTESPYFMPFNPVESNRRWESFKNSCYPPETGLSLKIPVGAYLVYSSRGPEYSLDYKVIELIQDKEQKLTFHIDKVLNTENFISVDPHMHTYKSDGAVTITERIKSVVAEGVDVAIATDHNYITDYWPTLKKLGLDKYLYVMNGNEVSTSGVIHYNSYPLKLRENERNNGAIYPLAREAATLFRASRAKDPNALIQVNHPRSGTIGYFNNCNLDPKSASFAQKNFDASFDVLEIMNGPNLYPTNNIVITDWLNLLNRGYYFPAVGSSDSHTIDKGEPGYSRTYVYYSGQKGDHLDEASFIQAIKKGHSFVSNGPLIDLKVNNTSIPGETLTDKDGTVEVYINVQSAPWISVDEVRIIINGKREFTVPIEYQGENGVRFTKQISLKLEKDSFIAVEALGEKSLFPVLQNTSRTGLLYNATLPYALTNPIFIDVDGNGKFDAPLNKIKELPKNPETKPAARKQN
ncbi:MAG: CehA/McbA family metallohydrolase [Acidobacteriota bacterium]|nr:CehA/McbA family metallohydrolase [Acidobacteriota bacterium]